MKSIWKLTPRLSSRTTLGSSRLFSINGASTTFVGELPSNEDNEGLVKIRHSAAHVMAMAVQKLFPKTQIATSPWIEHG